MKKLVIQKASDMLTEEVMVDIDDKILTIDPDTIDAIIQKAVDDVENQSYEKILNKINAKLELHGDHMDKWW